MKLRLDPDVVNLQKILVEEGLESCCKLVKKMSQTDAGRDKLQQLFGSIKMDGKTFLDILEGLKMD